MHQANACWNEKAEKYYSHVEKHREICSKFHEILMTTFYLKNVATLFVSRSNSSLAYRLPGAEISQIRSKS